MRQRFWGVLTAIALASPAGAQTLLDGFEGGSPALANGSPGSQSSNHIAPRGTVQNTNASFVLQGTSSCQTTGTWELGAPVSVADPYETGAPNQIYWSIRAHHGVGVTVAHSYVTLEVDIYNANTYSVDAAIIMNDGAYKRNAWKPLVPNAWTKLSWNVQTEPGLPAVTGGASGLLGAGTWVFRGIAIHTTTAPANSTFNMYVDNLVGISAQSDTTAPAAPSIVKVEQGSAPGKARVTWVANVVGDGVTKYTINFCDSASWQRSLTNRFSTAVVATKVDVAGAGATTGEIDVSTTSPSYLFVTATDNATPLANTSAASAILGVRLAADGVAPKTLVVLDNKRYTAASGVDFTTYGYEQMIAYYAVALNGIPETFVSAVGTAVGSGQQTLTASPTSIVIWSAGLDGNTSATAISTANAAALTTYVNAGGDLFINGANAVGGLFEPGSPAALATFANNILKADLVTTDAAQTAISNLAANAVFSTVGDIATGTDVFSAGAGSISTNDALAPHNGEATTAGTYGATANIPILYRNNQVVVSGFGFEQVRDPASAASAPAGATKRAALMSAVVTYLRAATSVTAANDWQMLE